jgi:aquaporin Z
VLTGAYALGPISGGHFNPAVSIGLVVGKRFSASELPGYIVSQVLGAIAAAAVLFLIVSGKTGFTGVGGFASNGYGADSPGGYSMVSVLVTEVVMTAVFLLVILGATSKRAAGGFGGLAIGLCLTLIHLVSIPVSNTSVNPARSTGPALFAQTGALGELWLFWVAPIAGAVLGAVIYNALLDND